MLFQFYLIHQILNTILGVLMRKHPTREYDFRKHGLRFYFDRGWNA